MPQAQYTQGVYDGKLLAVPLDLGTIVCLGWKPLLKAAGLPLRIPDTFEEFKEAVAKISALGPDIYGFGCRTFKNSNSGYWFFPPMWGHGGKFEDENGKVIFNNAGVVAALDWYKEAAAKKHIPLGVDVRESRMYWAKERVGFIFDGPWMRGVTRKLTGWDDAKADGSYVIGPHAQGPGRQKPHHQQQSRSGHLHPVRAPGDGGQVHPLFDHGSAHGEKALSGIRRNSHL